MRWAYAHYPDFLLKRCIPKAIISVHLESASNSVFFCIVSFRLIVCQLLEDAFAETKKDVTGHAQMLLEYAQSHFSFLEHIMLGKPSMDSFFDDFGHAYSKFEVPICMSFLLKPMLHINDLSSDIPDLTLILTMHDECLKPSPSVNSEGKKQGIKQYTQAYATTCMLTIFRKSLGQRCQVRGLTKALQHLVQDNDIVAKYVSQWLLYSLCTSNVECFPCGKNIGTRFLMHRTVNALQNSNLNFAKQFISSYLRVPWTLFYKHKFKGEQFVVVSVL